MHISAVVATAFGGPEVLSLVDLELSDPKRAEVLVEVHAAGTNPVDFKLYSGSANYGSDPSRLPMRLGLEAAGVVLATGGEAEGPSGTIREGDEVIVYPASGAYASAIIVPTTSVISKPAATSFEEASGLMLTGATAVHGLHAGNVSAGDTVLIHGAAGGVGLMAVQLAVGDGARVIGTAGESQHELLRSLGAEPVVYGDGLLERVEALAPEGVDAALDCIGTAEAIDVSVAVVEDRTRIVTIVASPRAAELDIKRIGGGPGADPGTEIRAAARLELVRRVELGSLRVIVAATYPLSEVQAAHRELKDGHAHGKIVLLP
jgi:NADPH:quinone reductase-like Zn-dependent oxidoreductase